jgi:signal transduction histidine kinase
MSAAAGGASVYSMQTALSLDERYPLVIDAVIAAALIGLAEYHVWSGAAPGSKWITAPAALAIAGAVSLRRRAPLVVLAVAMTAIVVQSLLASPPQALWLIATVVVLQFSVGAGLDAVSARIGLLIALAAMAVDEATAADRSFSGFVFVVLLAGLPWLAGRAVYARQHRAETSEARAARLEREREANTLEAIAAERSRIARELHDMVAHAVSLIVVKAEAAAAVLDRRPEVAHEQLAAIQTTGRQAISELGRLLGMLRENGATGELAPQPGLPQLEILLEQVRTAGLRVELEITGPRRPLAPGVDLAAYRIIQEALTNALKHAGTDACAMVALRYDATTLTIDVTDTGKGSRSKGGGHGLIGMRERVSLYGGTLQTGNRSERGFHVAATLPLDPDSR